MLQDTSIDTVPILTPNTHLELVERCAAAGNMSSSKSRGHRHRTRPQGRRGYEEGRRKLAIMFQMRFRSEAAEVGGPDREGIRRAARRRASVAAKREDHAERAEA